MDLSEIYAEGEAFFRDKACGRTLGYVETGFIESHDRAVIDRYAFRPCWVDAGADAIVVSNHGGHTLDYLPHPLQVKDETREAVGDGGR